jgi:hypothetical protein
MQLAQSKQDHQIKWPNSNQGIGTFANFTDGFTLIKGISSFGMKQLRKQHKSKYDPNYSDSETEQT